MESDGALSEQPWSAGMIGGHGGPASSGDTSFGAFRDASFHRPHTATPPPKGFSGGDLPRMAWRHRWLIVASVAVAVVAGASAHLLVPPPSASALLLSRDADGPTMQTELSILRSQDILQQAVSQAGAGRVIAGYRLPAPLDALWQPCGGAKGAALTTCAMARVANDMNAVIDGATLGADIGRVVRLTARNPDPAVSIDLLRAAIAAEVGVRRKAYATARAETLRPQLAAAERDLAETTTLISKMHSSNNVLDISHDIAAVTQALSAVDASVGHVAQQETAVQAELSKARALLQHTPVQVAFSKEVATRDASEAGSSELMRLRLQRAHLVQLYSKDYPGILELDRKIAIVARPRAPLTDTVRRTQRNPAFETLSARVASLEGQDAALAGQRVELARQQAALVRRADALGASQAGLTMLNQKLEVRQAVARQLSLEIAQLQSQDTLTADRVDDLQVLQAPTADLPPWWQGRDAAGAGLLGGTAFAVLGLLSSRRRIRFYTAAGEAERHLGLPALADLVLWRRGEALALPDSALGELAGLLLEATGEQGGPVTGLHLAGTAPSDGAPILARGLAAALLAQRGGRVLLVHLEADGEGFIESIIQERATGQANAAKAPLRRAISVTIPAQNDQRVAMANIASAVLGDWAALGGPLQLHVARLRSAHDFVIVVSAHGTSAHVVRRLSANADLDVLVVRAGHSPAPAVARLSQLLQQAGGHRFGFVFTRAGALFSGGQTQ